MKILTVHIVATLPDGRRVTSRVGETVKRNKRPALSQMQRTVLANALRRAAYHVDRSSR